MGEGASDRAWSFFTSTTVFVETNLGGRHLAFIASRSYTVSDLKKKIEAEFPLCFPDIGEVKVEALKVKREGKFYCLADSMPVSVFCEAKGSWFVGVDVRRLEERVDGSGSIGAGGCENVVGIGGRVKVIEYQAERDADGCDERVDQLALCVLEEGDGSGEGGKVGRLRVGGVGGDLVDDGVENKEGGRVFDGVLEAGLCEMRNGESEETSQRTGKHDASVLGCGKINDCVAALPEHQLCGHAKENAPRVDQFVLSSAEEEINARTSMPVEYGGDQGKVLPQDVALEHPVLEKGVLDNNDDKVQSLQLREAEDSMRDGFANKGERVSAQGAPAAGSHQMSKSRKKKRKRAEESDASALDHVKANPSLDTVVSESWVANAVAGALRDVMGETASVAEEPSISASSNISTRSRHKVHQADVLPEGVDTPGEVVMCEKNESRNKLSNVNFSEDVWDASNSNSIIVAKKKRKIGKEKSDAVSMKENISLISGNGESTSRPQLASEVIRGDPSSRNFSLKPSSHEDPEGVHSQSNVIGHSKKRSRKKTMETGGNDVFKEPATPVPESMVSEPPPAFSRKDCNSTLEGSNHVSIPLGNATTSAAKSMGSSKDAHSGNVGENHYLTNKESDDTVEFDQHNEEDRIQTLPSSVVKQGLRYGVENEHEILMRESALETGSLKKTKRKVKMGHKRAEEGHSSLHGTDKKGSKEDVAVPIISVENAAVDVGDGHCLINKESGDREKVYLNSKEDGVQSVQIRGNDGDLRNEVECEQDSVVREGGLEPGSHKKTKQKVSKGHKKAREGSLSLLDTDKEGSNVDVMVPISSVEIAAVEALQDIQVGNARISDGAGIGASSDTSKRPSPAALRMDPLPEGAEAQGEVQGEYDQTLDKLLGTVSRKELEDALKSIAATKKKQKRQKDNDDKHTVIKSIPLAYGDDEDATRHNTTIQSTGDDPSSRHVNSKPSSNIVSACVDLQSSVPSKDKKTRKKKASNQRPSVATDSMNENNMDSAENVSNKEPAASALRYNDPDPPTVSGKEDCDIILAGAGSLRNKNKVLGDNQHRGAEQSPLHCIHNADAVQPWHNKEIDETSKLAKAPVTVDSGKSSKKPRKSKEKKDVNGEPKSGAEHAERPGISVTPSQSFKVVNYDQAVDVGNEEGNWPHNNGKVASGMDGVTPQGHKTLDSAPGMESSQASIVGEEGKSKKKMKKKKSLGAKDGAELLVAKGNDNRNMGFSSEKTIQTDQYDASGVSRLNKSKLGCQGVDKNPTEACHRNEASNDMEASSRSGGINFQEYFGCSQGHDSAVSGEATADAIGQAKQRDSQIKADKVEKTRPSEKVIKQQSRKEDRVEGGPKKLSTSNAGEVVDSSEPERRVQEKSGALSKVNRDRSYTNEDSPACSDASTRTPSDSSCSSDYSDGESYTVNSMEKGSTKNGGRKSKKAIMSAMSLNEILRSSRSYKKAKINASQTLLEDTESQPVHVVPDSYPGL